MDKNNPAEMTNADLEKEADNNKSTAAEGELVAPENDKNSKENLRSGAADQDKHNGSIPDPEEIEKWENNDEDADKITG